jgi:hypothetical protein
MRLKAAASAEYRSSVRHETDESAPTCKAHDFIH